MVRAAIPRLEASSTSAPDLLVSHGTVGSPRHADDLDQDLSLYFEGSGLAESGETIVFSHGLLWSVRMFDAQVEALRGRFRCVAYERLLSNQVSLTSQVVRYW